MPGTIVWLLDQDSLHDGAECRVPHSQFLGRSHATMHGEIGLENDVGRTCMDSETAQCLLILANCLVAGGTLALAGMTWRMASAAKESIAVSERQVAAAREQILVSQGALLAAVQPVLSSVPTGIFLETELVDFNSRHNGKPVQFELGDRGRVTVTVPRGLPEGRSEWLVTVPFVNVGKGPALITGVEMWNLDGFRSGPGSVSQLVVPVDGFTRALFWVDPSVQDTAKHFRIPNNTLAPDFVVDITYTNTQGSDARITSLAVKYRHAREVYEPIRVSFRRPGEDVPDAESSRC